MTRLTAVRLLALLLMLTVCTLSSLAVDHWHKRPFDEQVCQGCHIGQCLLPLHVFQLEPQSLVQLARFALPEDSALVAGPVVTPSIPRAPPT